MTQQYAVLVEGLSSITDLDNLSKSKIETAAVRAINKLADHGRARAAAEIGRQVNLPASYLSPSGGRLAVSQKATKGNLEARIRARTRATSLARFVTSGTPGKPGVRVSVRPGSSITLPKAFLMKLRAGKELTDTKFNLGLAVRLKSGESLRNKYKRVQLAKNLYLLYGPSVDQVFLHNDEKRGVAVDLSPELADKLEAEFTRLLELGA